MRRVPCHEVCRNGRREISASVNSIIQTLVMGLAQTLLLAGISLFGYIAPASSTQILIQPEPVRTFFSWCFSGLPMIGYGICAVIMLFYDIGDPAL